ncbi:hypothetical protein [Paenibacillus sp. A14]|uniref:hypothetical protein n=1 Tax=Paenibacillus sp. A14 TaxID=3119820 RepID=UPI002FE39A0C
MNTEIEGALKQLKREWEKAADWLDMAIHAPHELERAAISPVRSDNYEKPWRK